MTDLRLKHVLRKVPAMAHLRDQQLNEIVKAMRPLCLQEDQLLFDQGDSGGAMYLLAEGLLQVDWRDGMGESSVGMGAVRPGEFVGEMGLFDMAKRSAAVVAMSECLLYELGFEDLALLEEACPPAASAIIATVGRNLVKRIHRVNRTLEEVLSAPATPPSRTDAAPPDAGAEPPPGETGASQLLRFWARMTGL